MTVPDQLRLPLSFDANGLAGEVEGLAAASWTAHFNQAIYQGDWSGVALRSVGGRPTQLYPDPTATGDFADTDILASCPLLRASLAQFQCPTTAVRLLALGPGATIAEHRDYRLGYDDGEVRLHIPILSSTDVDFVLNDRIVDMNPGECWYLNVNLPHRVTNRSTQRRVHLVVDCIVDPWLAQVFDQALRISQGRLH